MNRRDRPSLVLMDDIIVTKSKSMLGHITVSINRVIGCRRTILEGEIECLELSDSSNEALHKCFLYVSYSVHSHK